MAIDNRVEQIFERIWNDPELRWQLAQVLFGRELLPLSDQVGQVVDVMRQLAETVQQGFRISGERLALLEEQLLQLNRVVSDLAEQQRVTATHIVALTERSEAVEAQLERVAAPQQATPAQIAALTARMEQVDAIIAQLAEQQRATNAQIAQLAARVDRLSVKSSNGLSNSGRRLPKSPN